MGSSAGRLIERLFTELRRKLLAFIGQVNRSRSEAADLAHEVFLRMLRVSDPASIGNPEAYLFTVASNLIGERANRRRSDMVKNRLAKSPVQCRRRVDEMK